AIKSVYFFTVSYTLDYAAGFAKTGKDDTSVLLAGEGDALLHSFGGVQVEDITNLVVDLHSNITINYLRLVRIVNFYYLMMDFQLKTQFNVATNSYVCTIGSFSNTITPPTPANAAYLISIVSRQTTLIGGFTTRQIRISTDSSTPWALMMKLAYNLVGCFDNKLIHITYQTSLILLFLNYEMSCAYYYDALYESAGLFEFSELYDYLKHQDSVPPAQRIPIGEQTLQKYVKDNDDILNNTSEEFIPPVLNATSKLDLSSQQERSSFLASSGSDTQLIVYCDRVTLTASYETTGLFPN
ncbi:MAG: hypothetical protein EZS28_030573, partial [Streblomastix strix]